MTGIDNAPHFGTAEYDIGERSRRRRIVSAALCAIVLAGCGGGDARSSPPPIPPSTTIGSIATTSPPTTAWATTTTTATVTTVTTALTVDDRWMDEAAATCAAWASQVGSEPAGVAENVAFQRDLRNRLPWFGILDLPDQLRVAPTDVPSVARRADEYLTTAEAAVAAGDNAAALLATERYLSLLEHAAALVTVAGAKCGDPARAASASLNVPIPDATQITAGAGSVWVAQPWWRTVTRVDADSGEVLATIDVGGEGFKIQPADGRMIVRTADSYVAIDATTNSVADTLAKADVGPAANRSWAVDGAMWICDGQRLHRYNPTTFEPTGTVIELGIDCGQVYATDDLVVAWTYNQDPGESGTSAAVFVDPTINKVLATTPLPADAGVPIVLDEAVFFPAQGGTLNPVVDRATWTVTATPDYGRSIGASQMAYDGRSIYLVADKADVLVVDPVSYKVTDTIKPLTLVGGANALSTTPGALWVGTGDVGILQRFDVP